MLAETVTRLEMSWKKLLRAEKGPRQTERNRAKGGPGEKRMGENEMVQGWKGSEGPVAYVIRGEKTELKARYHLSSGKWYSDAPVVFHVGGFYNARYYSPLPAPSCLSRRHAAANRPADLSRVWPPSCSFYIAFSVHVRQRDWHSSNPPPILPTRLR